MKRAAFVLGVFLLCLPLASADKPATPRTDQPPAPTSLTETLEKRLVQFDVGVEGDPEAIRGLTAEDFVLKIDTIPVQGLIVDRLCDATTPPEPPPASVPPSGTSQPKAAPQAARTRATFVFYFDQPHLTMAGRALSLDLARELIDRLVVDGARASLVSSARRLETIVPMTGDREKLLAGVKRIRSDFRQWDSYAATEESRAARTTDCNAAMSYAREEWWEAKHSTERLAIVAGTLAETPAPKGLVYFGDNLRQSAGLHFLWLGCGSDSSEYMKAQLIPSAAVEFDAVIKEALSRGVHFYTIQAEGILPYGLGWDSLRHQHAQDALVGLAAETGGEAFLGGASNKYIADRIEAQSSCRLLLSFPPGDFPRDAALMVTLKLHVPKVKIQPQGRIVIPSAASIERAQLVAAFVDPASTDDGSLRAFLIPRGGDGKTWKAVLQLRLRASGIPGNGAELGASILRRDKVSEQVSASIATKTGSRPSVLEKSLDLAPGEFAVVAVARDTKRGDIGSTRLDADWPSAAKDPAAIVPIAVLQTGPAAMSRDGAVGSSGLLARDVDELLDPSASITLKTVVCRGKQTKRPVVVERWVEDGLANDFAPMTITETGDPCVQTVDVVRAGRLQPGVVDYRVTARIGDEVVAQERRALRVGATGESR